MAKSLKQWLGTFVETELASVIEWNNGIKNTPNVKNDPDSRFSDDGSNFRVAADSSSLSAGCKVQLLKVSSKSDPATVLLSDGTTSIKATLSEDAISALEEELEENLSLEMRGDVLSLTSLTIVSTPYGPADGHVRLDVEDWQYEYHLRKTIGDPKPIEQQPQICRLIESIKKIRSQQYADGNAGDDAPPVSPGASPDAVLGASQIEGGDERNCSAPKAAQRRSRPRSPLNASSMSQSHAALATQLPPRKKVCLPSLDKEGFEVEAGVNLSRPSAPNLATANHRHPDARRTRPPTVSIDLLNLLGVVEKPSTSDTGAPGPLDVNSGARASEDSGHSESASQADHSLNKDLPASVCGTVTEPASSGVSKRSLYARRKIPRQQQRLLEPEKKQAWFPSLPGHQFPTPNVPIELLQAWNAEPSLVDLVSSQQSTSEVRERNDAQETSEASGTDDSMETSDSSSDEEVPPSQWPPSPSPPKREMLPPDSTVGSTQTRLPVNGSQNTPVQSPVKPPSLPLDSPYKSTAGTPRLASTQQLPLRSPVKQHPLPPRPPPSTFAEGEIILPPYAAATPARRPSSGDFDRDRPTSRDYGRDRPPGRARLPDRPFFSPRSGSDRYVPSHPPTHPGDRPPPSRDLDRRERDNREIAAREWNRRNAAPRERDSREPPRRESGSRAPARRDRDSRAMASRDEDRRETENRNVNLSHTRHAHPPAPIPRSSGLDTVIKGTQFSNTGDEMEMDVPRPLQNPALLHQQRRTERFQPIQRREWLEANYITTYESIPYISTVHREYLAAYPADPVSLADFKQAMESVFPALWGFPPRSLIKRRDMASLSRPSSVRPVSRHLDGSNDADDGARTDSVGQGAATPSRNRGKSTITSTDGETAFAIYEDHQRGRGSKKGNAGNDQLLPNNDRADRLHASSLPTTQTLFAKPSSQQVTNGHQEVALGDEQAIRQDRTDDTQDTDQTPRPPTSALEDFLHAWQHLKPGGAFAKPEASGPKPARQQMDILAWKI